MRAYAREHVPGLTALLSVASLALVFGAVLGAIPAAALPRASEAVVAAIPHVNAVISALAIVVIAAGWRAIRVGKIARHRAAMVTATGLFALFLALYLYKVVLVGPTQFSGPPAVERYVYLPTLAVHVLLAIVTIPLVYYALLLAWTHRVAELPRTRHPAIGRVAAALWLVSFSLGLVVYLLLYVVY